MGQKMELLKRKYGGQTLLLANRLEESTGLESRITILGYLLRGGAPSASDRVLATQLGTRAADLIHEDQFGFMVGYRHGGADCVPLEEVAGCQKKIPLDHSWIKSARHVGTILGD
jgi:6-phosphofructokinase 1